MDILSLFTCFQTLTPATTIGQLSVISQAMLSMTGRITMLSISRWAEKGGSYRTVQRFFAARLPWSEIMVKFFQTHLFNPRHEYLLAGDATTVTKSGRETCGIGQFFSSILGKAVKGVEFFVVSLIDVQERKSSPLTVKQTVRSQAEKEAIKSRRKKRQKGKKKKPEKLKGRPTGVLNKDKTKLELSPELLRINELLKLTVELIRVFVQVKYLALDGHFGHHQAVLMAQSNGLELISKLRKDAALFEKYQGEYRGTGRRRKYGARVDSQQIPAKYLKQSESEGEVITNYYQGEFVSKSFASPLNVVIIEKINVKTKKLGHALLFSSDMQLSLEKLIEYYGLRFQIEFNFRDAKQHFGLEDFMTRSETGVENAACVSFLMVNLSAKLLREKRANCIGINDLKAQYRGIKYALATIKLIEPKAEIILIEEVKKVIGRIGSIHRHNFSVSSA